VAHVTSILDVARSYAAAGLSVVPIRLGGSKAPALEKLEPYFSRIASDDELVQMFSSAVGIGVIGGHVSGNLEIMDFDQEGIFDKWLAALADLDPAARKLTESLPHVLTPTRGMHLLYRCSDIATATKLAFAREKFADCTGKKKDALIETRGERSYAVTAPSPPSCHAAKRAYQWIGGAKLTEIPTITPKQRSVLWQVARSFNEREPKNNKESTHRGEAGRPGDEFNDHGPSWRDILQPHGWVFVRARGDTSYWRRPGKMDGISATTGYCGDKLHVFSSNASPFEDGNTYSKFAAFAELNHNGSYKATAKRLGADGYGKKEKDFIRAPPLEGDEEKIPDGRRAAVIDMGKVEIKPLLWLWPGYLPLGKLGLLDGDPCLGKSMTTLDLAARVTTGREMPDHSMGDLGGAAGVVLMSCEDDAADTIKPRLVAAGADCDLVRLVTGVKETHTNDSGEQRTTLRTPTLEDVDILRMVIDEVKAKLVIIDPLMAYMTGDTHRDSDARHSLAPMQKLAEETGSTVLVVRHLNKSGGSNALYRGGGSIGIIGAARAGLLVAKDPEDSTGKRRILARTKANLAADADASLVYKIIDGEPAPRIEWLGSSAQTATSVLAAPDNEDDKSQLDEAIDWLKAELTDGQQRSAELLKKAKHDGVAEPTLRKAKARLRVRVTKGFAGWLWELPEPKGAPPNTLRHDHLEKQPLSILKNINNNNNLAQDDQDDQDDHQSVLGGLFDHLDQPWDQKAAEDLVKSTISSVGKGKNGTAEKFLGLCRQAMLTKDMDSLQNACDWYAERTAIQEESDA
jgi:hypothetical protein